MSRRGRLREVIALGRSTREALPRHPVVVRLRETPAGQLVVALYAINLRDRALTLAGQAFIALVPLLVVVATWTSGADAAAVGDWLVARFSLAGDAAVAVQQLFERPPSGTSTISLLGLLLLLLSVSSFARALQRTYEAAWGLPGRARRRLVRGWCGSLLLLAALVGLAWATGWAASLGRGGVTTVAVQLSVQLAVAVPVWWVLSWLLLSGRVSLRRLLPGAAVAGVAQVVTSWGGAVWVPYLIERNASRYGVVGVAVALISWLVVLALMVVATAVVAAQVAPGGPDGSRSGSD